MSLTLYTCNHWHSGIDQTSQKADLQEMNVNQMKDRKGCVDKNKP